MNDTLKMYGSIGSEIMNRYFVVAMCFKRQPRWRRLQTINSQIFIQNMASSNASSALYSLGKAVYRGSILCS